MPEMMRVVRYNVTGPPSVLVIEEHPVPQPGEGQVLIKVHAAGVNPTDTNQRRGERNVVPPATPGSDVSGIVAALGPGVAEFQVGDAVFGSARGSYAEYAVAAVDGLAPKPDTLSFDEAASVPMGARTAWGGIFTTADLQPGQRLLVTGASGGVGIYAVQLGHWKGAEVIGTTSAANAELVRSLGADTVIDYNATPTELAAEDVDVVFETVSYETQERAWQALKPGGIMIGITHQPSEETLPPEGFRFGRPGHTPGAMRLIADLFEQGLLRTIIRKVLPLEQAAQAHELSETHHGAGRIVLRVSS
ncbi:MAG: NADP-dependent oxidoreductase [Chloroflexi bacterium]|nr:NADP-dependent oxidoreductase [Chloroflexota bacterium]